MKRILFGFAASICVGSIMHIPAANGALITIVNHSFEDPSLTDGVDVVDWNGWNFTLGTGGTWNINGNAFWNVPAPDGNNVGYLTNSLEPGIPAEATQSLDVNLLANSSYKLLFIVGHPIGFGATVGTEFTADLRAGGNILASVSGTGLEGSFQQVQLLFDSTGSSFIGQELSVNFYSSQPQTAFDSVQLSVTTVPEPSSALLFAFGLAAAMRFRRKRSLPQ
ncbi:PEP-CTERM sorting domain-containing protein [Bythopirellula polymerisocia]|uniref:Ice-binding protein C-terminal domain-containing protein n=1 Tax=Bythopirellula polymerisocia TaxID=2528003 RepID=A0A5C6CM23_9BACT|nr:PEP-CTERM sorting domain-containing protein [Bythopirellula polymerisocia]TWU24607.1 hypothetical protein Pla144_34920 [Bythopirellula polymerisocia]